jgi:hypothetical protein
MELLLSPPRLTTPNKYSQEELRLMKTQDIKYLHHKERVEAEVYERQATTVKEALNEVPHFVRPE